MAIEKTILIDGKEIKFKCSADTPRRYRLRFRKDLIRDMQNMAKASEKVSASGNGYEIKDLEMFENVSYIMAKQASPSEVPDDISQWLDQFNTFSIYEVLPVILDMWGLNTETEVTPQKK